MARFAQTLVVLAVAGATPGMAQTVSKADYEAVLRDPNDNPAFQRFLDKLPTITTGTDVKRTYYVIEGDFRVTRDELRARLNSLAHPQPTASEASRKVGSSSDELYVNLKNGVPTKWAAGQRALTYAVDRASFPPGTYDIVVKNMREAAPAWVDACQCELSITHRPELDDHPTLDQATFVVKYMPNELRYFAVAFFPGDPTDSRYLYVMAPYFTTTDYDVVGIFRHEIGHIMGYRHSHINGVPGCELYEETDKNWKALSPYDSKSVMHYPCGGGGSKDFVLSDRDKEDHRKFYSE
jgi:hypothetical protein